MLRLGHSDLAVPGAIRAPPAANLPGRYFLPLRLPLREATVVRGVEA